MPSERQYDVAFSFLTADLSLARRLAEALTPLETFVYAEQQPEIVTQDGMDVFGAVFGRQSRLNVVLYRAGYGERGWTHFEREVIKGRCLNEGWPTFALIRADDSPVPAWVPQAYIYGDVSEMDVEALAGAIRVRAKTVGVAVPPQDAATRMARLASDKAFERETEQLGTGMQALSTTRSNFEAIHERIREVINADAGAGLRGSCGIDGHQLIAVNLGSFSCFINYHNAFGSVTHGKLRVRILDGPVHIPGTNSYYYDPNELGRYEGAVSRTSALGWCWLFRKQHRTSKEVADFVLDELIRRNR